MSNKANIFVLNEIALLLKVPLGKISFNDEMPTRVEKNVSTSGNLNIILGMLKESKSDLGGSDLLEIAQIRQWLEYGFVYAVNCNYTNQASQLLKDLNAVLSTKTYLVAHRLTIADVLLYYILFQTIDNLNNLDKEKFVNVSRWFDNLQQNSSLRQSHKIVDFSTNYLTGIVPVKH